MQSYTYRFALLFSLLVVAPGCGSPSTEPVDGGPHADREVVPDAGPLPDGEVPDGGIGGEVVECEPAGSRPPLASGAICEATPGDQGLLIIADVLAAGEVLAGGQVLVDPDGTITCVACDCSGTPGAATATKLDCPDGVLSPGLINAHEHITFQGDPPVDTGERYEHRHDWRTGARGHTEFNPRMATREGMMWAELRMVMSGVTSINASGGPDGLLRNLDRATMEELGQPEVEYDTFPLGDSRGTQLETGCGYGMMTTASDIARFDAYTPHIAEGIDVVSRNEFLCVREGENDLIQDRTALIHGIGLLPQDIEEIGADGAMLIWSPRSNVSLYGETARVTEYDRLGVPIALGTDWIFSGSMNMLRELECADSLNADYFDGHFDDRALFRMATDDVIGAIAVGRVADLAIYDGSVSPYYRAVIDASPEDVALVLRAGIPLYGESTVVPALRAGDACDAIEVCGAERRACVQREIGMSLDALSAANGSSYPLFFCDATPTNEPSCHPQRATMVMGANAYDGMLSATDPDGDGIPTDAGDLCPSVFNPIRPLDMGAQADFDRDGVGDACDPCPLEAASETCAPSDPNDRDRDAVPDDVDNCPGLANGDQLDSDADGKGDLCDPCPADANPGAAACPSSIYDVKDGTIAIGTRVSVRGVVTAVLTNGFFAQVPESDADYVDADFSGVFVFTGTMPTVARGALVAIDGATSLFPRSGPHQEIQFTMPTVTALGTADMPAPIVVAPADVATGGARAAALEGVLVRVEGVAVTDPAPAPAGGETAPTHEFQVGGALLVDDVMYRLDPMPAMEESFASITGVLQLRRDHSKLLPRDADDVVAGTARLAALGPALSYARVGAGSAPTFPTPLTVRLTRAVATATEITLTASSGATVGSVVVAAGASSAVVPVTATIASATPITLTATLGTDMRTASVRVLGATETPSTLALSPTTANVRVGTSQPFTVTIDIPAPPGGTEIDLSATTGSVPATVTIPADRQSATFDFVAGDTATTGSLTASAPFGAPAMSALTISAGVPGTVLINEVDYDQDGTDTAEFIELFNPGVTAVDLSGLAVVLINGSGGAEYARAPLSGSLAPGEYLVIGVEGQTLALPAGTRRIDVPSASGGGIQNGNPDGIAIVRTSDGALLDAFSYAGPITTATIGGRTYSLVEGTMLAAETEDTPAGSLVRSPNGSDTDDAATDWALAPRPTPGAPNED
jgi:cytosine/adenosine deaminase-related metal-dependent hydrolase